MSDDKDLNKKQKNDQSKEKVDKHSPSIRIFVELKEPNDDCCPVFNYRKLLAEEKKRRKIREAAKDSAVDDDNDNEPDDDAKRMAKYFEEKYGGKSTKNKKSALLQNYSDLAMGYDENDPFIDNSESYDEALPEHVETYHGGYYVNIGKLEFKKVETMDRKIELEDTHMIKQRIRGLSSDESDNETEECKFEENKENSKLPVHVRKEVKMNENRENGITEKMDKGEKCQNKVKSHVEMKNVNDNIIERKRKRKESDPIDEIDVDIKMKKKPVTVKALLQEKRSDLLYNILANEKSDSVTVIKDINSINDVIESVVNAGNTSTDEASRDSSDSSTDSKYADSQSSHDTEKDSHNIDHSEFRDTTAVTSATTATPSPQLAEYTKLPDNLPNDVVELVNKIKTIAISTDIRSRSFFNTYINSMLLSLEIKTRCLASNSKHIVYGYLANFLPCSKDTLMKRTKKLLIEEEEKSMIDPLKKLKAGIDHIMPTLMDRYTATCQKIAEDNPQLYWEVHKRYWNIGSGNNDLLHDKKFKMPHKRFHWTEELRGYLRDIVLCQLNCYYVLKPRKETSEEYIMKFLESRLKILWPDGWMTTSKLLKECDMATLSLKMKKLPINNVVVSNGNIVPKRNNNNNNAASNVAASTYNNLVNNSIALALQYSTHQLAATAGQSSVTTPNAMELLSRFALPNTQQYASTSSHSSINNNSKIQSSLCPKPQLFNTTKDYNRKIEKVPNDPIVHRSSNDFNIDNIINKSKITNKKDGLITKQDILDLSPNKLIKSESDIIMDKVKKEIHKEKVLSPKLSNIDHDYSASGNVSWDINRSNSNKQSTIKETHHNQASSEYTGISHLMRKQRVIQDTPKPSPAVKYENNTSYNMNNQKMKTNERARSDDNCTDFLSRIINDTLQDSTPLQPPFSSAYKPIDKSTRKLEKIAEEEPTALTCLYSKKSNESKTDRSSPHIRTEQRKSSVDRAELEAAEVIKDLLALNQMGSNNNNNKSRNEYIRSSIKTSVIYQPQNFASNNLRNSNSVENSKSSTYNNSSRQPDNSSSTLPRMNLGGFENEFLKHIQRSTTGTSNSNGTMDKVEFGYTPYANESRSTIQNNHTKNTINAFPMSSGNANALYQYHQTVIMPPTSSNKKQFPGTR